MQLSIISKFFKKIWDGTGVLSRLVSLFGIVFIIEYFFPNPETPIAGKPVPDTVKVIIRQQPIIVQPPLPPPAEQVGLQPIIDTLSKQGAQEDKNEFDEYKKKVEKEKEDFDKKMERERHRFNEMYK